jgi:hypothetical protein
MPDRYDLDLRIVHDPIDDLIWKAVKIYTAEVACDYSVLCGMLQYGQDFCF